MPVTNIEMWNKIRNYFPQFASHTSEGTRELFTSNGYDSLKQTDPAALNEFLQLSLRVFLLTVNISHAEDRLEDAGFGEYFDAPFGGIVQKMAVDSVKPISPVYDSLKNGDSPDPFVVRKPVSRERFWKYNFNYQSVISYPDDVQYRQIFINEFGMSEYMAGVMTSLENGYITQKYLNKLEALNAGINADDLKPTQEVTISMGDEPTSDDLIGFILAVRNVVSAMTLAPQTSAFNAYDFSSIQDKDRLKLLVRPDLANAIRVKVMANAYHNEELNLPIDVIEVPNFGGMIAQNAEGTTLKPYYDTLGTELGFSTDGTEGTKVADSDIVWKDPNENVKAVIADKGYIFEARQNPYTVEPIRNPRGLYTNFWASSPHNTIAVDKLYNMVKLQTATV